MAQQQQELTWSKPVVSGDIPSKKSGHSFTIIGSNAFLFGGLDESSPIGASNDMYQLKMSGNLEWVKLGDDQITFDTPSKQPITPRWNHSCVAYDRKYLVVFGGFESATTRLNDVWVFDTITLSWSQPMNDDTVRTHDGNHIQSKASLAPSCRGGHSASVIENRMWICFGYGGSGYARRDFNDVHVLDLENMEWQKVPSIKGAPPKPRSSHSANVVNDKIYIYGGRSSVEEFADLHVLDTTMLTWTSIDVYQDVPRWAMASCSVEAIPYWKVFYFGGSMGNLSENKRAQGSFSNNVMVLDSGSNSFDSVSVKGDIPCARADMSFVYDSKGSRLVTFGGWNNQWLNDVYTLEIGSVVGPPYAVMSIYPESGPITGGTELNIKGIDFKNDEKDPRIKVRFQTKRGEVIDVPATFVDKETITCVSPNFDQLVQEDGEVEVDVRVAFKDDSFTTTFQKFKFLTVADHASCVAFGPGLLDNCAPNSATSFIIHANDNNGTIRSTGGDEFSVYIKNAETNTKVMEVSIEDNEDGTYLVEYTVPSAGSYLIEVNYDGSFKDSTGQRYETGKSGPIRGAPFTVQFDEGANKSNNKFNGPLLKEQMEKKYQYVRKFVTSTRVQLEKAINPNYAKELASDVKALLAVKEKLFQMEMERDQIELDLDVFEAVTNYLQKYHNVNSERKIKDLAKLRNDWEGIVGGQSSNMISMANAAIKPHVHLHGAQTKDKILDYELQVLNYEEDFKPGSSLLFYSWSTGPDASLNALLEATEAHELRLKQTEEIKKLAHLFEFPELCENISAAMGRVSTQLTQMRLLWEVANDALIFFDESKATVWRDVQPELLEDEAKKKGKALKSLHKDVRWSDAFMGLEREVKNFLTTCPLIAALGSKAMRDRHWRLLKKLVGKDFTSPDMDDSLRLSEVLDLNLHEFAKEVEDIADQASKEAKMETALSKLERTWNVVQFIEEPMVNNPNINLLRISEEDFEALEVDQLTVQSMMSSRFVDAFMEPYVNTDGVKANGVRYWHKNLLLISEVTTILADIQRIWSYLEPLFIQSEEVKKALPDDAERFKSIDADVRQVLQEASATKIVLRACGKANLLSNLETIAEQLEICKKSLVDFLDTKRTMFPRFYFTSEADLLDILSNGSSPEKIMKHVTKVFLATKTFELDSKNNATHWVSSVGKEIGEFTPPVPLTGKVESYLQDALDAQKASMQTNFEQSLQRYAQQQRTEWLLNKNQEALPTDLAQISLLVAGASYVNEVEGAFESMQSGNRNAMQDLHAKQKQQLADLIQLTLQNLDVGDRQRVMGLITIDAHARDIVDKLIHENVSNKSDFQWQSQLKQRIDEQKRPFVEICDARFDYGFEYLGNGPRLVITPLTDRIYVTATQALHLKMGCAPAGPAGTGKTETTKDLAAALGKCCYVFNCAPEMDYRSMGNIFKGLAASGSWGCFDEFNRLKSEVLSVCTVQFKAVCDGIRANENSVTIEESKVNLDPTCGVFITMNPGYLGRSELPEGLKALFRPMTVMVPDLVLICENMLMAEGFVGAKELASKFYGLYSLCKELLSKQPHYDWGLRAVKSVLVVAGSFKRAEPELHEEDLLLRALRDFNIPKITQEDQIIFYGLLNDLFPGRSPPRKISSELEEAVKDACGARELWPDGKFLLKVVQLEELLQIRHCVFVMGAPGSGKSECWRTLQRAKQIMGVKTTVRDINPKAQDPAGLYGYISMATREWKDGLLSKTMRDLGTIPDTDPKWIILDGDLDANWIESMNSVMDDNKMLTLASNERIPLHPHMRMIFEIRDLAYATPATTSRAGIIYLSSESGSQWKSLIAAWVQKKDYNDHIKETFNQLFEKYVPVALEEIERRYRTIIPVEPTSMVSWLLLMLDSLVASNEQHLVGDPTDQREALKVLEPTFMFCAAWALGSAFAEVDGVDYRKEFSDWWKTTFKTVKFPSRDTIFDYYLDPETDRLDAWKNSPYFYSVDFDSSTMSMTNVTIPTPETAYVTYWMERHIQLAKPMMLVGGAGCGKTAMVRGVLRNLDSAEHASTTINFNFYTNAVALQRTMEASLEKKMGNTFGPPGQGNLIYFLDDLNLPEVDEYNTQDAIALLRQHIDYGHIYDRQKLIPKSIINCHYIACMNHTAGSFSVNPRLQRHFTTFAIGFPGPTSLLTIYQTFLDGHLAKFDDSIKQLSSNLINGALSIHTEVVNKFRKTARNFHYEFNIRHLSNVFQGLLVAQPNEFSDPAKFTMLWLHESERVYGDRLVSADDLRRYKEIAAAQAKRRFPNINLAKFFASENADPLIFCHFANQGSSGDRVYDQVTNLLQLHQVLSQQLVEYNEYNATMNLVLFEDAMKHVCRISRIILNPGGHAMLVGVGGMGKQSLSRLAAYMCGYETTQIVITPTYSTTDFKDDLKAMYAKAGLKGDKVMFLFTDSQISDERFLVYLNDLLSSGKIPDLYTAEEIDGIVQAVVNKVKISGLPTDPATCFDYFIDQIRNNLHCVLCFSPVGDAFRNRARKFPALVNCTVFDVFQPWPMDALLSVGKSFLQSLDLDTEEIRAGVENFMPFSFESVERVSQQFLSIEKRHVYTTPKSYLELLKLYSNLLSKKREENQESKQRLQNGLKKLQQTSEIVTQLESDLKTKLEEAEEKKIQAEAQAEEVERESEIVARETEAANLERAKCDKIAKEVNAIKDDAQRDLDAAEPLVRKALAALDTLNKKDLGECKSMSTPPKGVDDVFNAVMILLAGIEPKIQLTKAGKPKNLSWEGAKKELFGNVNEFLNRLKDFKEDVDAFRVPKQNWVNVRPLLQLEHFDPETIEKKNKAAGGVASWVCNIVNYHDTIVCVEPKRQALAEAEEKLAHASEVLDQCNTKVAELETKLGKLKAELKEANEVKQAAIDEVESGQLKLDLAQRLTTALASENTRWASNIEEYESSYTSLTGDVLLASAFISYVGPFTKEYRERLLFEEWIPFMKTAAAGEPIPMSADPHPVSLLATPALIASWQCDGLPQDSVSTDNGAITEFSQRWPLIIDPQLQGTAWIQAKEKAKIQNKPEKNFTVIRMENKDLVSKLIHAVEHGESFMIENMGETIDASIMPVVQRQTIIRGSKKLVKLGEHEVVFHPDFRLFLHTKLSNPHYQPEIQAECALINFSVTQKGLEEQLLALVVSKEREDLASKRAKVIQQQNKFTVKIKELEDNILASLANAEGDICSDVELIESLEHTKKIALDIEEKSATALKTQEMINQVSEKYRSVAARGSLLFFIINSMHKIHTYYMYSLNAFVVIFLRGIDLVSEKKENNKQTSMMARLRAAAKKVIVTKRFDWNTDILMAGFKEDSGDSDSVDLMDLAKGAQESLSHNELSDDDVAARCNVLQKSITEVVFNYIRRGLFDKDNLTIATQLCFKILEHEGVISSEEVNALVMNRPVSDPGSMGVLSEWMPQSVWARVKSMEAVASEFSTLGDDIMNDADDWQAWFSAEKPEEHKFPGEYNNLGEFKKLLLFRVLRPDRMNERLANFVQDNLGESYVEHPTFDMEATYQESSPSTPLLFFLFPGVDPGQDIEELGKKLAITKENNKLSNISMGQGQEANAEKVLREYAESGGWVFIQNLHLVPSFHRKLERLLETLSQTAHQDFRCFISSEPPAFSNWKNLPESLLQSCIKIANENPSDLKSNLKNSLSHFEKTRIEACSKPKEFQQCLFALSFFHAVVLGRRKFGSSGWSRPYSFNNGDLHVCSNIIENYIGANAEVPWQDLRYIIGEIMYGGHITDPFDRRTNNVYLDVLLRKEIMQDGFLLGPGFEIPKVGTKTEDLIGYVDKNLPKENPSLFGLHANAEIGYLTNTQNYLFQSIFKLNGTREDAAQKSTTSSSNAVRTVLNDLMNRLPNTFDMTDIKKRAEKLLSEPNAPYVVVAIQECERMNKLLRIIRKSLDELLKGLNGSLNMTDGMSDLLEALSINQVPGRNPFHVQSWEKYAWWSNKSLDQWFLDLLARVDQLRVWTKDLKTPKSVWLPGLFNPMAFITAVSQVSARKNNIPLDTCTIETHVTMMSKPEQVEQYPAEGMFVHGLFMEGARYSIDDDDDIPDEHQYVVDGVECGGQLVPSRLKELLAPMPVLFVRSVQVKPDWTPTSVGFLRNDPAIYECPCYTTTSRGPTFIFIATMKTGDDKSKWVLSGAALMMQKDN